MIESPDEYNLLSKMEQHIKTLGWKPLFETFFKDGSTRYRFDDCKFRENFLKDIDTYMNKLVVVASFYKKDITEYDLLFVRFSSVSIYQSPEGWLNFYTTGLPATWHTGLNRRGFYMEMTTEIEMICDDFVNTNKYTLVAVERIPN